MNGYWPVKYLAARFLGPGGLMGDMAHSVANYKLLYNLAKIHCQKIFSIAVYQWTSIQVPYDRSASLSS